MNRRESLTALFAFGAVCGPLASMAEQPGKVWRIGMLETISMAQNAANLNAFLKGMRDLGYVEGRNFVIDYRSAGGRADQFPELAAELVRGKVDLIVTRGTPATEAARKTTKTIPVISAAIGEPLIFAASLARPGGNVTGLTPITTDLSAKRVELLRELVPGVARIAVLFNMSNAASLPSWKESERAAQALGVQVELFDVRRADDLERAFEAAVKRRANALIVGIDALIQAHAKQIVMLATKHRLPSMYSASDFVDDGGLISYGVSYPDLYRRVASYVDRIMKGSKAGDLPIELPSKIDLAINRNAAKILGLTIPPALLARADRVIE